MPRFAKIPYSKAIDMTDEDGWAEVGWNYLPALKRNRALAGYDVPHNFQLGFVYELPFGQGKKYVTRGLANWMLGGWQANGVFSSVHGTPFTVTASGASLNAPDNTQTANQLKPTVQKIGGVGPGQFFYDPAAFAPVTTAQFGTTGRNILFGPGSVNLDLSLSRKFRIRERLALELRAEAFNSLNTPHFSAPDGNANDASFMQISSAAQDQRQLRFGLRLSW